MRISYKKVSDFLSDNELKKVMGGCEVWVQGNCPDICYPITDMSCSYMTVDQDGNDFFFQGICGSTFPGNPCYCM